MALVEIENVSKIYKTGEVEITALNQINLSIETSAFVSFVGPSGSGKTTMLNMIGCLDKPSQGRIMVDGKQIDKFSRKERALLRGNMFGFIFQSFNLFPVLTAYENIEYPLVMIWNETAAKRKKTILDVLDSVGMLKQKDKFPDQLSGGQKQRMAVARALVTQPKLVMADEPTANLDKASSINIIRLMREMKDKFGTTFIFSTHDPRIMEEAEITHILVDGNLSQHKEKNDANI